jgi:antitoxin component YwqK of YwqJK toxin-antitoxin module
VKKILRVAGLMPILLVMHAAFAVQDCELNGQAVTPNDGNTTAGKAGVMRCKERDTGLLTREQELQNGKFTGLIRRYQDGKLQTEYSENARGNRQGRFREFSPAGKVLRDETYDNGDATGLSRTYYAGGQLKRATWFAPPNSEQAYVEFTQAGQLNALRCGDKPLLSPSADDTRLCGFSGPGSSVEFFGSRGALNARSSYVQGKRVKHETFNDNGKPSYSDEISDHTRLERYFSTTGVKRREVQWAIDGKSRLRERDQDFSDNGTLTRDRRWGEGKPVSDVTFYLNGQPRSKTEFGGDGSNRDSYSWSQVADYFDSGKPSGTGRFSNGPRGRQLPIGLHQQFNESGKVVAESTYDDNGRITREKAWDVDGKLLRDDAVFEDGSRKAFTR